ncbi:periplasmic solute binding protein [gut metagenome]|uniref:Periplasmic solute binding protein n=1 Tax=gut metagenome TaxID=749906 RepID=J9G7N8_9ZZZZ
MLVCVGGHSEAWLDTVLDGQDRDINKIVMLDCVNALEEEHKEGMQISRRHEHEHKGEQGHHHEEFDEHVWCSPINADRICREICLKLTELDPDGADYYLQNYRDYSAKLMELNSDFEDAVKNGKRNTLVFADRFPVRYFVEEYGLDYYAAFPGCADDVEPSAKTVAFLIDMVRENDLPAVLHIEFSNEKMADIICEETGCEKLLFHSCHNVTKQELDEGVSYLELMRQNVLTVKEALS